MPFTFSHPAIILPLAKLSKRWVSLTGLVFGSMAPDFEYFIRMRVHGVHGHHWWGMLYFNLPVAFLLCFIYHNLIKRELILNLPLAFKSRLIHFIDFNWNAYFFSRHWITVILSIFIGAFSHVFWDHFTHGYGFFVSKIHFLQSEVMLFNHQTHWYNIMQHLSTIFGGLAIFFAILRLPRREITDENGSTMHYWFVLCLLTLVVLFLRITLGVHSHHLGTIFVSFLSAGMISLVLTPVIAKRT